ncbi:MAG: hypothetical protein KC609_26715 [Myxococcales bacterium]|nr:hypothetical protein [Myxococcales bacterium]
MKGSRLSTQMLRRRGRAALQIVAFLAALGLFAAVVARVVGAPAPAPIPGPDGSTRFGIPLSQRKAIYETILSQVHRWRRNAAMVRHRAFNRHVVFMAQLSAHVRRLAVRHHVSATQLWLVVDEGIRNHWTSGRYPPLPATVVPLSLTTR